MSKLLNEMRRFLGIKFLFSSTLFVVMGMAIVTFNNFINSEVRVFLREMMIELERQNHRNQEAEILNYLETYFQITRDLGITLPIIMETMRSENLDYRIIFEQIAIAKREANDWIDNIFIGFSDGSLVNSLGFVPEYDWDSRTRDWFEAAVLAGHSSIGVTDLYLSYATGEVSFAISTYIPGEFVTGVAVSVDTLMEQIYEQTSGYSVSLLLNSSGYVIGSTEPIYYGDLDFDSEYVFYIKLHGTGWYWIYLVSPQIINERVNIYVNPIMFFSMFVIVISFLLLLIFILSFTTRIEHTKSADDRIKSIIDSLPVALNITKPEDFSLEYANKECYSLFNFETFEEYRDCFKDVFPKKQPNGKNSQKLGREYMDEAFDKGKCEFEWLHITRDGYEVPCYITLIKISLDKKFRIITFIEDLRNKEIAFLDDLTGAFNRRFLSKIFSNEAPKMIKKSGKMSLILFDLDNFKKVNDIHGHVVGDIVLKTIVENTKSSLNPDYTFARYGGEEFAILLPDADEKQAKAVATKLKLEIANFPIVTEKIILSITCSFGVYTHDYATQNTGFTLNHFLNQADKALYSAKAEGKNRVVSYESLD